MYRRYLVTGCAGFIGWRVCELLLEQGELVVGIDNLNDAYDPRLKQWRLERLEREASFRFCPIDITDMEATDALFAGDVEAPEADDLERRPYSAVIHLAARAGIRASVEKPSAYFKDNVDGTLGLLEHCRKFQTPKIVLASSSSLYGAHNPVPYREDADTDRPFSPYAASKKAAETLCYTYHHLHGLDVSVLRYFTVYGPAGRPDMSVFRFIRWIAEGKPVRVFGDGLQSRDFTYVDDIARGTVAALRPLGYEVINLGGNHPTKVSALIDKIAELLGKEPQIEHLSTHPTDVPATCASIEKASRLLDWAPLTLLPEGLRRSIEWYQANRELVLALELGLQ